MSPTGTFARRRDPDLPSREQRWQILQKELEEELLVYLREDDVLIDAYDPRTEWGLHCVRYDLSRRKRKAEEARVKFEESRQIVNQQIAPELLVFLEEDDWLFDAFDPHGEGDLFLIERTLQLRKNMAEQKAAEEQV